LFSAPVGILHVEHLGHRAPADIFDQQRFFVPCRRTLFGVERPQDFDGLEILRKFLFGSAFAESVVVGDAIIIGIFWSSARLVADRKVAGG
jgi:hypothetical protein